MASHGPASHNFDVRQKEPQEEEERQRHRRAMPFEQVAYLIERRAAGRAGSALLCVLYPLLCVPRVARARNRRVSQGNR